MSEKARDKLEFSGASKRGAVGRKPVQEREDGFRGASGWASAAAEGGAGKRFIAVQLEPPLESSQEPPACIWSKGRELI